MLAALVVLACSGGIVEESGAPCAPGKLDCGECTDVSASLQHCGACGNACGTGQNCTNGACTCLAPLKPCGGSCVNVADDPKNCGSCGAVCGHGLVCSNGACGSTCQSGQQLCGASCTDVKTSTANCGGCGRTCDAGESCSNGACVCLAGRVDCGGQCVDVRQDALHCGQCGKMCSVGEACNAGACVPAQMGMGGTTSFGGMSGVAGVGGSATGGSVNTGGSGGAVSRGGAGGASIGGSAGRGGSGGASMGGMGGRGGSAGRGGTTGTGGTTSGNCARTGFYVQDGKLFDKNCREFIMRGVNYPYAWYSSRNMQQDLSAIAATGANSVRIVLATGARWGRTNGSTVTSLINAAKAAKLVAVLETHDQTGWSEQAMSVELANATAYWTSADVSAAVKGQEAFVIINIANEPMGNNTSSQWAARHVTAVQALRSAGLDHTLMVDGPNWAQDWQNTMRNGGGSSIWNADTDKNMMFSVHMYDVFESAQTVSTYFNTFLMNYDAPLVVGEFAADHGAQGGVDENAIMMYAESLGIGYLGWSWSGNGGDLASLDITNGFNASSLTTWGNRLINGANGIKATSDLCSCFN